MAAVSLLRRQVALLLAPVKNEFAGLGRFGRGGIGKLEGMRIEIYRKNYTEDEKETEMYFHF